MSLQTRLTLLTQRVSAEINSVRAAVGHNRRMQPFHLSLAQQDVSPSHVWVMGDSAMEGAASSTWADRALTNLQRSLREVPGGQGFIPAWISSPFAHNPATYSNTPVPASDNPSSLGVAWDTSINSWSFSGKRIALQKRGWAEWTFTGDQVRVWYSRTTWFGISAQVLIDGNLQTTLSGGGSDTTGLTWTSGVLSTRGPHTIRIIEADNLGGGFWLDGVEIFDGDSDKGVHVYDASMNGIRSEDYTGDQSKWQVAMGVVSPSLVMLAFGHNDSGVRTPAQFKTDLNKVVTRIRSTLADGTYTLALVAMWAPAPPPAAGWDAYMKVLQEVADAHPTGVVVDIRKRWPLMVAGSNNSGMFGTNTVLLAQSGQRLLGRYIADSVGLPDRSHDDPNPTTPIVWGSSYNTSLTSTHVSSDWIYWPAGTFKGKIPHVSATSDSSQYNVGITDVEVDRCRIWVRHITNSAATIVVRVRVVAVANQP